MFKKMLLLFPMLLVIFAANAQFRKIPAAVTDAFKAKYEKASGVSWKDKLSAFQAEFKLGEKDLKATFSTKGEWLKTETKYDYKSVPSDVKDGFKKSKYADLDVLNVTRVEEKDKTEYKIAVKKSEYNKKYLVFNKDGQLLSDNG
ncbi:MAG TPA: PepSY-like domain-containing protein, partial [Segetibacter sp.]